MRIYRVKVLAFNLAQKRNIVIAEHFFSTREKADAYSETYERDRDLFTSVDSVFVED